MVLSATLGYSQTDQPSVIEDFKPSCLNQPGKEYPQVNSQGYARFRIEAPQAQSVVVSLGLGGTKGGTPLAKADDKDPRFVQRYQAVIAGSELCNGYSELNDPIDQLNRFVEQEAMREAGDSEAMMLDIDYVEMLEYGMPPTTGLGFSERIFWIFEGVSAREGVPFPQLKTEIDSVTKAIYSDVKF